MPERIQLKRTKGWRMPANTVKVDRSTRWGNPYPITTTAANAVGAYLDWLECTHDGKAVRRAAEQELRGKNLACWCKPGEPCHADVLLSLANA